MELNTNLGEERGCPSLCHSMVGGGKPSARQVSRARWPGWASTTLGWFLSRSSLQNTAPPHSHQGDPLHKPEAPFSPSRFSFLTAASFGSGRHHNRLGLSCFPCHLPPPLPQNLDCPLPALHLGYSVLDLGLPALCNPSTNVLQGLADPLVPGALPLPQPLGPGPWIPLTCLGRGGGLPLFLPSSPSRPRCPTPPPPFTTKTPITPGLQLGYTQSRTALLESPGRGPRPRGGDGPGAPSVPH